MSPVWTRITTEAAFRAGWTGRRLIAPGLDFTIEADGTLHGTAGTAVLAGRWHWADGLFCRHATLDGEDLGWDCEIIEACGARMRYTRQAGRGAASIVARAGVAPVADSK